jgi:GNAT superfamily N-acetyltransferase
MAERSAAAATQTGPGHRPRFTIRPATLGDAEPLARLAGQLGYPSSPDEVERRLKQILARPEHTVLVAEARQAQAGRDLAGWVHAYVVRTVESDPTVQIGGLVVEESWRGRGVGRLLMAEAERWARSTDGAAVTLRSNVIREGAHAFYQRLGYALIKSQQVFRKAIQPED